MKRNHGNQHESRKAELMKILSGARYYLRAGLVFEARMLLEWYRADYAKAPASTKRRWRCGQ